MQLAILRNRLRKHLPLINIKKADIPLNILKMPILLPGFKPKKRVKFNAYKAKIKAAKAKSNTGRKGKKAKANAIIMLNDKLPFLSIKLTFFDLIFLFSNLIASDIFRIAH